jgi:nitrogen fixation NifU-like protein
MFDDLGDLYQQLILDHNARPRNFGQMPDATHKADGYNPLCGDKVTIFLQVQADTITGVRFDGQGCAISRASASLMTDALSGKPLAEVEALFAAFHSLLTQEPPPDDAPVPTDAVALGKLEAFSGVREFPMRVKCATLPWHTLRAALQQQQQPVSTEA